MRLIGIIWLDMPTTPVLLVPGFMQRGSAWAPVAELLPERYPSISSTIPSTPSRAGCGRSTAAGGGRGAVRLLAGRPARAPRRAARPVTLRRARHGRRRRRASTSRRRTTRARRRRREDGGVDGDGLDRGHRARLGAPAAVRRPVGRAGGGAAPGPPEPRAARAGAAAAHRGPGRAGAGLVRARAARAAGAGAGRLPRRALRARRRGGSRARPAMRGPRSSRTRATRRSCSSRRRSRGCSWSSSTASSRPARPGPPAAGRSAAPAGSCRPSRPSAPAASG